MVARDINMQGRLTTHDDSTIVSLGFDLFVRNLVVRVCHVISLVWFAPSAVLSLCVQS